MAGGRDIRIGGGANVIQQYLNAGLVDEFTVSVSPIFLGGGVRLFDGIDRSRVSLRIERTTHSPQVTHLHYTVEK